MEGEAREENQSVQGGSLPNLHDSEKPQRVVDETWCGAHCTSEQSQRGRKGQEGAVAGLWGRRDGTGAQETVSLWRTEASRINQPILGDPFTRN